jgi:hypothetical protein
MASNEYYAPLNGGIVDLVSGASVAPGETVKLSSEAAKENADAIERGALLEIKKGGDK